MPQDKYQASDFKDQDGKFTMSRRNFLQLTTGGLILLIVFKKYGALQPDKNDPRFDPPFPDDVNAILTIDADGRVTCLTGKIEMGQGVMTSLPQIMAEELTVNLDRVNIIMGDTDLCPYDRGTFGSLSIRQFGVQMRQAVAKARTILLEMAAVKLKTPIELLSIYNGTIYIQGQKHKGITYGELVKGQRIKHTLKMPVRLKNPSHYTIVTQSVPRRDSKDKVTGKAQYAADIQRPGMLYAKIIRPPAHGATVTGYDLSAAEKMEGIRVIRDGDLIAILHRYPDVAAKAATKVKVKADLSASLLNENNIFDHLLKSANTRRVPETHGRIKDGRAQSKTFFQHTYLDGYVAHASMEPPAAVAEIKNKKITVWAATQTPFRAKEMVAEAIGFPIDHVRIITPFVGGGFGGKSHNQQAVEAARLAVRAGVPVQVAWDRREEFFYDYYRPAAVVKIDAGLSSKGQMSFWDFRVYFAGERGSHHYYNVPHLTTTVYGANPDPHPFNTGAWRAPANNTNTFARESTIDMMASQAGIDPLQFRLDHVNDNKMRGVLKAAAKQFGWSPKKGPSGRGWGIACGFDAGSYVATIAKVDVNRLTGTVKVKRMVCAQDMGLCVNPTGAKMQIEGGLTMGLGYALMEDVRFRGGEILDTNFDTYKLPRFSHAPKIETVIIDARQAAPQAGGEPAIITVGGAIGNAIYDAIGARLYQMPMTPARIKTAIKKSAVAEDATAPQAKAFV